LVKAPLAGAVEVAAHALERQLRSGGVCLWLIKRPAKTPHFLCSYVSEGRAYLSDPLKVGSAEDRAGCVPGVARAAAL
jgi:hypothetical protein